METPGVTGMCVFSFDPSVTPTQLRKLVVRSFALKEGDAPGELRRLQELMRRGDTEYFQEAFVIPESWGGVPEALAAPTQFLREWLPDGYLRDNVFVALASPDRPHEVCPLPKEFWTSDETLELIAAS